MGAFAKGRLPMLNSHDQSRREFMKRVLALAAAVPATRLMRGGFSIPSARADGFVPESDAVAQALSYKLDAKAFDFKKYKAVKKGSKCDTCSLYTKVDAGSGKCQLLQSGLVKAGGLCGSYSKKA